MAATLRVLAALLVVVAVGGAQTGQAETTGASPVVDQIDVVTFNVLAPVWASPSWYPEIDEPALLDRDYRRTRLVAALQSLSQSAEMVCLQEVAESELPFLEQALGPDFVGAMSFNAPEFWADWVVPPISWEPNGTALFVRSDAFADLAISGRALPTGNSATTLTATHRATGTPVTAWSVHLDSDRTSNRGVEMDSVLDATPPQRGAVDVICGDLNEDAVVGTVGGLLRRAGFVDVLSAIGNRDATHPWSDGYYKSQRWAILDHVVVRGATPVAGTVVDAGVADIEDQSTRIEEFLRRVGSDHYPVIATITVP